MYIYSMRKKKQLPEAAIETAGQNVTEFDTVQVPTVELYAEATADVLNLIDAVPAEIPQNIADDPDATIRKY